MGIFGGFAGLVTPEASKYKASIRSLERMQVKRMMDSAKSAIERQKLDKPRQQAQLKQGMFARGLGKSTIFDQDKSRLDMLQTQRDTELSNALRYAKYYKRMIGFKHTWERYSQYYEMIDSIIGTATGAGGAAGGFSSGSGGGGAAEGGAFGESAGSYYTSGVGASQGGQTGAYYGGY